MVKNCKRIASLAVSFVLAASTLAFNSVSAFAGSASLTKAEGWHESVYAEWSGDSNAENATVEYKKSSQGSYTKVDEELVRSYGSTGRVDIPGLAAGSYDLKITTANGEVMQKSNITVDNYDRSGYAHFNYNTGVGAYNNDGTPKSNAIIVYVTEENKDTVTVPGFEDCGQGIGWILNNNRAGLSKITANNSLIVRIIGKVTNPEGTTAYNSTENGGSVKDNGHMARMRGGKNITIEGIGYDALVYDWGFHFIASDDGSGDGESFEVRNITFDDYPEDAVGMEGVQVGSKVTASVRRCWVHNNSFLSGYCANPAESDKGEGDGSCDFKRGEYFTLSYNYFEDCHKTNLVGASDSNLQFNLTFHHNWWKNCASRGPLLRQANIHIYNNYYEGNTSKTIDTRANSYAFVEGNFLESCKNPVTTNSGSAVKAYNNIFYGCLEENSATVVSSRDEIVSNNCQKGNFDTNSSAFYYDSANKVSKVERLTDAATAKAECIAYSGVMKKNVTSPVYKGIIEVNVDNAVSLPYSIDFTSGDASEKMTANGISNLMGTNVVLDNIVYNAAKKYNNTSTAPIVVKDQSIAFKLDREAEFTMDGASGSYVPVLINDKGESLIIQSGTATIPAGIYAISSSVLNKEAKVNSFSIKAVGSAVETTTKATTTTETTTETTTKETTTKATTTTTEKQTETTTKKQTTTTEKQTETTTEKQTEATTSNGNVSMGSYSLNSSSLASKAGTYKNINYSVRGLEENGVKLRADNYITFTVGQNCTLNVELSGKAAVITGNGVSETLNSSSNEVELKAGAYTIAGSAKGGNTIISKLTFTKNEAVTETTTKATTTTEATTETTTKATTTTTETTTETTTKATTTTTETTTEATTEETTQAPVADGVSMGSYSFNSSTVESKNCTVNGFNLKVRSVEDNMVKVRNGNTISFTVGQSCNLEVAFDGESIIITDGNGNVIYDGGEVGTVSVSISAGDYVITGASSGSNTAISSISLY